MSYDLWLEEPYRNRIESDAEPWECEDCGCAFDSQDDEPRVCNPCGRERDDENHAEACAVEAWKGDDEEW